MPGGEPDGLDGDERERNGRGRGRNVLELDVDRRRLPLGAHDRQRHRVDPVVLGRHLFVDGADLLLRAVSVLRSGVSPGGDKRAIQRIQR